MPGIVGFTAGAMYESNMMQILEKMQELITYGNFYKKDELFYDEKVYATRSHTNIIQKQPQPHHESGIYVWFDGEFYNQDEISIQLKVTVNSEPALLNSLFKEKNNFSFLKQIDGIYSAVIYDSNQEKVHLIANRYGLRHLYWTVYKGSIIWGSEVKTVLAFPNFKLKIDRVAVEQFLGIGYLLEERTWLEGVQLLSSGSVLTWDIKQQSSYQQRYWWWDEIKPQTGSINENEVAEELGRLFIDAVERRSGEGEQVGLTLSGGLDSRAILAAMPERRDPIHAVTMGKKGCDDIRIAAVVAKAKGAIHHVVEIDENNWLTLRLKAVWQTDGHLSLKYMHGIGARKVMKDNFQVNLNGIAGGAILGGRFLRSEKYFAPTLDQTLIASLFGCKPDLIEKVDDYANLRKIDFYVHKNRFRRFISAPIKQLLAVMESRQPFYDNKLIDFIYSLPDFLRFQSHIYRLMLLKIFPSYYNNIPGQATGFPISWSSTNIKILQRSQRLKKKLFQKLSCFGFNYNDSKDYTDYSKWIRQESARSFFEKVL